MALVKGGTCLQRTSDVTTSGGAGNSHNDYLMVGYYHYNNTTFCQELPSNYFLHLHIDLISYFKYTITKNGHCYEYTSNAQVNAIFGARCYPSSIVSNRINNRGGISHWDSTGECGIGTDLVFLVWEAYNVQKARVNLAQLSLVHNDNI